MTLVSQCELNTEVIHRVVGPVGVVIPRFQCFKEHSRLRVLVEGIIHAAADQMALKAPVFRVVLIPTVGVFGRNQERVESLLSVLII